jgi:hypothetical protein
MITCAKSAVQLLMILGSAFLALPPDGWAQEGPKPFRYNWNSRVTFTTGTCWHGYALMGVAGGGEVFVWDGLSVGGDLAVQRFVQHGPFFGIASATVAYHFVNRNQPGKIDPFINMGWGGAFADTVRAGAGGLGGGLNYWFRPLLGLTTEARFQVLAREEGLLTFRIGVSLR